MSVTPAGDDSAARPLVSVVIPTHDRAPLLRRTLRSVAEQDHRPIEVVVIDDASVDETDTVLAESRTLLEGRGMSLRTQRQPAAGGPAAARNAGIALAQGTLIAFQDSDDLWKPRFLSTLVDLLDRYPRCSVAFSGHEAIDDNDHVLAVAEMNLPGLDGVGSLSTPFERFVGGFPFITTSTLVRRNILDTVGGFDETLTSYEDADLWLRIAKHFDFAYTSETLAAYRLHGEKISNRRRDWLENELRVRLRHVDDVHDQEAQQLAIHGIQRAQLLLQEEMLRSGVRDTEQQILLVNEFAPASLRYRAGGILLSLPSPVGRAYAAGVRLIGTSLRRSLAHRRRA